MSAWSEGTGGTRGAGIPEPPLYPVSLKMTGRLAVVVGGGPVAARRAGDLLRAGARVRAVAPEWPADFAPLESAHGLALERRARRFEPADLDGATLVVAATRDHKVQAAVARAADTRGVLCNVVDVNPLCSFYVPASFRRGALSIAVGTDGAFPLLAAALRDRLADLVGAAFGRALERLREERLRVRRRHPRDAAARTRRLRDLLDGAMMDLLFEGRLDLFEAKVASWRRSS